ncbi:MAG: NfeD family protein [Roseburia sp.]
MKIDNIEETGTAVLNGQEWTARSNDDAVTIEADTTAEVVAISGVKLIVKPQ